MKYIKKINESFFLQGDLNELKDFCETYLAYLIDKGFGIHVRNGPRKDRAKIEFYKEDIHFPVAFNWNDVKDHYIPFYQMLSKEYEISTMPDRTSGSDYRTCSVKFGYRKPARQLWETEAKWFTEKEIINDEVGYLGNYIGVISIFINLST